MLSETVVKQMDEIVQGALLDFGDFDEAQVNEYLKLRGIPKKGD